MVKTPTINFSMSLTTADILLFAAVLKKSLISKMLAEDTDSIMKKGKAAQERDQHFSAFQGPPLWTRLSLLPLANYILLIHDSQCRL